MPGGSTTSQQSSQQSSTQPWEAAISALKGILNSAGGLSTSVSPGQTGALSTLTSEAGGVPSFAPQASDLTGKLFNYNTTPQQGILTGADTNLERTLSPYLSSSYLNPYNTPGFSDALKTTNTDITNQVNDQFAAAGRDLSPGNTTALARGLSQGEGGLIANQFNQNVATQRGAAQDVFGAAGTTAGGLTAQQLAQIQANTGGVGVAGSIPQLATAPGATQFGVANAAAQQPFQNLGWLSSLVDPIAALGSQSQGTMTGSQTQQTNPLSNIIGGVGGGLGILGSSGAFGSAGWLAPLMLSDERIKDDIEPIGELFDGQKVYSYTYKGDDRPQIGLLAQEVEKVRPDAVVSFGPAKIRAVDYNKATARARMIGMLHDLDMAA